MADEKEGLEKFSFGGFDIENVAAGNRAALDSVFEPEAASVASKPEDVEKIKDEPKKKEVPKKEEPPKKEVDPKKDLDSFILDEEEEEEEIEETTDKKFPKAKKEEVKEEDTEDVSTSKFEALSKDLFRLGVFSKEEDEEVNIKSPEQFLERFNIESKKKAEAELWGFIGQFGEEYQNAFQAIYLKGVEPKEYFNTYNKLENIAELDLTVESNQESVVRQGLIESGLDADDVREKLEKIKNYGDLEDESKRYHKVLVKKEAQKLQDLEQNSQRQLQQKTALRQEYVKNVNTLLQEKLKTKEFDGIPLNQKLAQELQDFLVTEKYTLKDSGEKLTEFDKAILELKRPENHNQKVKLALLLKLMEKDPTLSTIQRTGITKKSNELFSEVTKQTSKSSSKAANENSSQRWFA